MEYPKYVIVEELGLECPIVFSPLLSHCDVVNHLKNFQGCRVVSAGECTSRQVNGGWGCWGKSVTLEVWSRNEVDEEILNKHFPLKTTE